MIFGLLLLCNFGGWICSIFVLKRIKVDFAFKILSNQSLYNAEDFPRKSIEKIDTCDNFPHHWFFLFLHYSLHLAPTSISSVLSFSRQTPHKLIPSIFDIFLPVGNSGDRRNIHKVHFQQFIVSRRVLSYFSVTSRRLFCQYFCVGNWEKSYILKLVK